MSYLDDLAAQMQVAADRLSQEPGHFQQHFARHLLEDRRTVVLLALREPEQELLISTRAAREQATKET
jgi:hypothetical protein